MAMYASVIVPLGFPIVQITLVTVASVRMASATNRPTPVEGIDVAAFVHVAGSHVTALNAGVYASIPVNVSQSTFVVTEQANTVEMKRKRKHISKKTRDPLVKYKMITYSRNSMAL